MENVLLMCIDNNDDDDNFMKSVFCVLCCATVWHVEKSVRVYGVYTDDYIAQSELLFYMYITW